MIGGRQIVSLPLLFVAGAFAAESGYPRLDQSAIEQMLRVEYPPANSNVNCFGATLVATGVVSVMTSQPNDEVYFSSGCFQEITEPSPGDLGIVLSDGFNDPARMHFAFHAVTYIDSRHLF